jgi:hypothetical protein
VRLDLGIKTKKGSSIHKNSNDKLIETLGRINSKTAKKILEKREAIQKLLNQDDTWKREGE